MDFARRIVVDTSALVAVIAGEDTRATLIERTRGAELLAPASVHWEIGNALVAMLRKRRADLRQARAALHGYRAIPLQLVDVELGSALGLAAELGIWAYDAYVIACAQAQRCDVLTLDEGLKRAARAAGVGVLELES